MKRSAASWCPRLALALALAGCSAVDPQVGPSQESCGVGAAMAGGAASGTGYGGAPSSRNGASPDLSTYCSADAGSPCDVCESTYCCMTRAACYMDPVCFCADRAMDTCLGGVDAGAPAPAPPEVAACWNAFVARGAVEEARVTCEQAWCGAVCAMP